MSSPNFCQKKISIFDVSLKSFFRFVIMIFLLLSLISVNLLYWILIFSKLSVYKDTGTKNEKKYSCSVVIPVRNEEQNIDKNLTSFLNQESSEYDIVVVDDNSDDNSYEKLKKLAEKFPNLRPYKNKYEQGKKSALRYGVEKSIGEIILLTDADCNVKSQHWAPKIASTFKNNTDIVLGYSPYVGKGLLNMFIRFETFMTALQYFSYYLIGVPYMGVGRNMAVRKSFFTANDVYKNNMDLQSGSDDLLVNELSDYKNTEIQTSPDTFVYTEPPESLSGFIRQKTRHISTSFRYKTIHKVLLSIYSFSHISLYLMLILGLFVLPLKTVFYFWLIRIVIIYITSFLSFIKLKEQDLLFFLGLIDVHLLPIYGNLLFFCT